MEPKSQKIYCQSFPLSYPNKKLILLLIGFFLIMLKHQQISMPFYYQTNISDNQSTLSQQKLESVTVFCDSQLTNQVQKISKSSLLLLFANLIYLPKKYFQSMSNRASTRARSSFCIKCFIIIQTLSRYVLTFFTKRISLVYSCQNITGWYEWQASPNFKNYQLMHHFYRIITLLHEMVSKVTFSGFIIFNLRSFSLILNYCYLLFGLLQSHIPNIYDLYSFLGQFNQIYDGLPKEQILIK